MPQEFAEFAGAVIYLLDQIGLLKPLQFLVMFTIAMAMVKRLTNG